MMWLFLLIAAGAMIAGILIYWLRTKKARKDEEERCHARARAAGLTDEEYRLLREIQPTVQQRQTARSITSVSRFDALVGTYLKKRAGPGSRTGATATALESIRKKLAGYSSDPDTPSTAPQKRPEDSDTGPKEKRAYKARIIPLSRIKVVNLNQKEQKPILGHVIEGSADKIHILRSQKDPLETWRSGDFIRIRILGDATGGLELLARVAGDLVQEEEKCVLHFEPLYAPCLKDDAFAVPLQAPVEVRSAEGTRDMILEWITVEGAQLLSDTPIPLSKKLIMEVPLEAYGLKDRLPGIVTCRRSRKENLVEIGIQFRSLKDRTARFIVALNTRKQDELEEDGAQGKVGEEGKPAGTLKGRTKGAPMR
jgi:hypothetical protein